LNSEDTPNSPINLVGSIINTPNKGIPARDNLRIEINESGEQYSDLDKSEG
jgi:hypothetical protein